MEKNVLTLTVNLEEKKGDSTSEVSEKEEGFGTTWHHRERSSVFVKRTVQLPESADTSAASASYTDGVLIITFPKKSLAATTAKLTIN